MKQLTILTFLIFIGACSSDKQEATPAITISDSISKENFVEEKDSVHEVVITKDPFIKFVDSMAQADYLIDTIRLKQVSAWREAAKAPKQLVDGIVTIRLPFIIDKEREHFTDPKTYFFAKWNKKEASFKDGFDYLVMTWEMDSSAVSREKNLQKEIVGFMGNFPAYGFRNGNRIYIVTVRMTSEYQSARILAEQLKNYINKNSSVFGPGSGF